MIQMVTTFLKPKTNMILEKHTFNMVKLKCCMFLPDSESVVHKQARDLEQTKNYVAKLREKTLG